MNLLIFHNFQAGWQAQGAAPAKPRSLPHCLAKLWEMVFFDIFCFSGLLPFSFPTPDIPYTLLSGGGFVCFAGQNRAGLSPFPLFLGRNSGKHFFLCRSIARFLHPYRVWMMFACSICYLLQVFLRRLEALLVRYSMAFRCGHLFSMLCWRVFLCRQPGWFLTGWVYPMTLFFIVPVWSAALLILRSTGSLLFWRGFFSVYLKSGRTTLMTALIIVNAKKLA